jgi:hypothetical protein
MPILPNLRLMSAIRQNMFNIFWKNSSLSKGGRAMSSNGISPRPDFDRRCKTNQTTDSICLHCLRRIANRSDEATLAIKETQHFCWQRQAKLSRMRSRDNEAASPSNGSTPIQIPPPVANPWPSQASSIAITREWIKPTIHSTNDRRLMAAIWEHTIKFWADVKSGRYVREAPPDAAPHSS